MLSGVKDIVQQFEGKEKKVDCLVCNAGILLNERVETTEGHETTFACHLLCGSYYLSSLLKPQLKAAGSEARVIFVSSGGMYNSKFPSWDQAVNAENYKSKYDGQMAYVYAKRGQVGYIKSDICKYCGFVLSNFFNGCSYKVLLAEHLARESPEITWMSCHPGWVDTPAVDLAYGSSKKYLEPMRSIWEGAEGICWLFSKESKHLKNGGFYLDRKPQTKHIGGLFMREGSYTKNTQTEVDEMIQNLKKMCDLL